MEREIESRGATSSPPAGIAYGGVMASLLLLVLFGAAFLLSPEMSGRIGGIVGAGLVGGGFAWHISSRRHARGLHDALQLLYLLAGFVAVSVLAYAVLSGLA